MKIPVVFPSTEAEIKQCQELYDKGEAASGEDSPTQEQLQKVDFAEVLKADPTVNLTN